MSDDTNTLNKIEDHVRSLESHFVKSYQKQDESEVHEKTLHDKKLKNEDVLKKKHEDSIEAIAKKHEKRIKELKIEEKKLKEYIKNNESEQAKQELENIQKELNEKQELWDREKEAADELHNKKVKNEHKRSQFADEALNALFGRQKSFVEIFGVLAGDIGVALGTGIDLDYISSALSGMSQQESLRLQSEYSNLYLSMQDNEGFLRDFSGEIARSRWSLAAYTENTEEATKLSSSNINASRSLGLSLKSSADFNDTLTNTFKQLNTNLAVTGAEFSSLTASVMTNADSQSWMFRLSEDGREQMVESSIGLYRFGIQMGKTKKEAEEMAVRFNEQFQKKGAKDYLKQTYKTAAVMGAMGMGSEAGEYTDLRSKKRAGTSSKEEDKRLLEIMGKTADKGAELASQGLAGDILNERLNDIAGDQLQEFKIFSKKMNTTNSLLDEQGKYKKEWALDKGKLVETTAKLKAAGEMTGNTWIGQVGHMLLGAALLPVIVKSFKWIFGAGLLRTTISNILGGVLRTAASVLFSSFGAVLAAGLVGLGIGTLIYNTFQEPILNALTPTFDFITQGTSGIADTFKFLALDISDWFSTLFGDMFGGLQQIGEDLKNSTLGKFLFTRATDESTIPSTPPNTSMKNETIDQYTKRQDEKKTTVDEIQEKSQQKNDNLLHEAIMMLVGQGVENLEHQSKIALSGEKTAIATDATAREDKNPWYSISGVNNIYA